VTEHIADREAWLKARLNGIGGSEAAAVLNMSPHKSRAELWREKAGKATAPDISDKPYIKYGKAAEPLIRAQFMLNNADRYTLDYSEFDMLHNDEYPFIFATLDGILTDKNGKKGILEIKTTEIHRKSDWEEWTEPVTQEDRIPQQYYLQVLHQLLATGFEFAVVCAQIKHKRHRDDEFCTCTTLCRYIERLEVEDDIQILKKAEIEFWESVKSGKEPPLTLPKVGL